MYIVVDSKLMCAYFHLFRFWVCGALNSSQRERDLDHSKVTYFRRMSFLKMPTGNICGGYVYFKQCFVAEIFVTIYLSKLLLYNIP